MACGGPWLLRIDILGVAVSVLMVMCVRVRAVMMYVGFPHVTDDQRIRALAPIPWTACCRFGERLIANDEQALRAQLESLAGVPAMRLRRLGRPDTGIDLQQGAFIRVDAGRAQAIARAAARARHWAGGAPGLCRADARRSMDHRPPGSRPSAVPLRVRRSRADNIYVSGIDRPSDPLDNENTALLELAGAIPHWMYFIHLRSNAALWSKVVIWTSILGTFLTLIGLYVGIAPIQVRGWEGASVSRRLLLASYGRAHVRARQLTWVLERADLDEPVGFLDSGRGADEGARVEGQPIEWSEVRASLNAVRTRPDMVNTVSLVTASLEGRLYWLATQIDGEVIRLDATGNPASVSEADLARVAQRIAETADIAEQGMLYEEDAYYFRGRDTFVLPVYRVDLQERGQPRALSRPHHRVAAATRRCQQPVAPLAVRRIAPA